MQNFMTYGNVGEPFQDEWRRDSLPQSCINEQDYEINCYVLLTLISFPGFCGGFGLFRPSPELTLKTPDLFSLDDGAGPFYL
jgi:hypothetical protein